MLPIGLSVLVPNVRAMSDISVFTVRSFETIATDPLALEADWRAAALAASQREGVDAATVEADHGDGHTLAVAIRESPRLGWDCTEGSTHQLTGEVREGVGDDVVAGHVDRVVRTWSQVEEFEMTAPVSDVWICLSEAREALFETGEERFLLLTAETVRPNGVRDVHRVSYYDPKQFDDDDDDDDWDGDPAPATGG